jgi:NitT/TauT family transport system substrate-binding protein
VRAAVRSWREAVTDPRPAIQSIYKMDGTLNVDLEAERLRWFIDHTVITANTKANGMGAYDPSRLKHNVDIVSTGLALSRTPDVAEVFDPRFIPAADERSLPAAK